ncbi:glycoside hydrolase family 3 protein [Prevotella sp. KH2C16]|uniref:beta-glucosidase n=1 Tax=Prevotella sp. KH2C16 TaxID=1855325 RepID=UPI0008E10634|nr:glycoside hydrolase family 3 N-terminal domain-containing protein [Prevotella sp. KH2C16]SFF91067.1 beta-glucosidase [Prevotella sp. KH2C16]
MKQFFILLALAVACMGANAQNPKLPQLGKAPVKEIVAAMTLEEKAQLLVGSNDDRKFAFMATSAGATARLPRFGAATTILNDGATGLHIDSVRQGSDRKYFATGFPISTLMASSWNTELMTEVAHAIAEEMVAYGTDVILAPSLNIQRNPLCGRNFEYYSEDPLLSGKMAAAYVNGIQSLGVGATVKHFACNNQQTMRMFNDSRVSQRALREIYLRNFEIAIRESRPWAVMSSYNQLNGTPTQYSAPLLTQLLRDEWKFDGIVMTDWGEPRETVKQIHAGNDLLMGGNPKQVQDIVEGVKNGTLAIENVDRSVGRMLGYILKTRSQKGLKGNAAPDLKAHARLAKEAAIEGMVLLKNEGTALPLQPQDTIALFGIGNYNYFANGLGSAEVNKAYTVDLPHGLKKLGIATQPTLDMFYSEYLKACNVQLDEINEKTWKNWFFGFKKPTEPYMEPDFIDRRAKDCSKAIITLSRNGGEGEDRDYRKGDYLLTDRELELIESVSRSFHRRGKQVVVVLNTGGAIDVASWKDKADGILLAWQPGQEGGNAIAEVLTGKASPSGKLTMTLANDYFDLPSAKNFPLHYVFSWDELLRPGKKVLETQNLGYTRYDEDIWVGYRYFNTRHKTVAYPFGYGLSYTTFEYSDARVKRSGSQITVTVKVKNTGKVAGKEAVQLYATAPEGRLAKPLRELKAFAKTRLLHPGESQQVSMTLHLRDLASYDESLAAWVADAGNYTLSVGASVEDIRCKVGLKLRKPFTEKAPTRIGSLFRGSI